MSHRGRELAARTDALDRQYRRGQSPWSENLLDLIEASIRGLAGDEALDRLAAEPSGDDDADLDEAVDDILSGRRRSTQTGASKQVHWQTLWTAPQTLRRAVRDRLQAEHLPDTWRYVIFPVALGRARWAQAQGEHCLEVCARFGVESAWGIEVVCQGLRVRDTAATRFKARWIKDQVQWEHGSSHRMSDEFLVRARTLRNHLAVTEGVVEDIEKASGAGLLYWIDPLRPPVSALALVARVAIENRARRMATINLGHDAAHQLLAALVPQAHVWVASSMYCPGARVTGSSRFVVLNIPSRSSLEYVQEHLDRGAPRWTGSAPDYIARRIREDEGDRKRLVIGGIRAAIEIASPGATVTVLADDRSDSVYLANDELQDAGAESISVGDIDTGESPIWAPMRANPWVPGRGLGPTGRLISIWRLP